MVDATDTLERSRGYGAKYRATHREKERVRHARYYAENKARHRAGGAKWRRENIEVARAHSRRSVAKWRADSPDKKRACDAKYRKAHPWIGNAASKRWKERNPESTIASKRRHYARRAGAPGRGVTAAQWIEALRSAHGLCAYCGERKRLTMDHVDPLALGGAHDPENVAAVCRSCNSSKNDTPLVMWLIKRRRDA